MRAPKPKEITINNYHPEVARLRELREAQLISDDDYQARHRELMRELSDNGVSARRSVPVAAFRPLSRSEIQAQNDAAVKAAMGRRSSLPVKQTYLMGVRQKSVPTPTVTLARTPSPEVLPDPNKIAEAEVREQFITGKIPLEVAREQIQAIRKSTSVQGSVPCFGCAPTTVETDGVKRAGFQDWGQGKKLCQVCNGKGRLTAVVTPAPVPEHDHRPVGTVTFLVYSATGEVKEADAPNGDAAVKSMIRMLSTASMTRAVLSKGVILTLNESRITCSPCNGKGQEHAYEGKQLKIQRCGICHGSGIVEKQRITRLFFPDTDKANKALLQALTEEGFKRSQGLACPSCKGKGCPKCGDRGFIRITVTHWAHSGTIAQEIRRIDLVVQASAPPVDPGRRPGGLQTMTRPSTDPGWAMPKGWARRAGNKVKFNRTKYIGQNKG